MDKELIENQKLWNEWTDINARSSLYRLDEFKKGENIIDRVIKEEIGYVSGKSLLHLQCHFGMDTLSWARLGADVTGVDFSPRAIELARSLGSDLDIPGQFICCNIYDLPENLDKQFDIVFASYGVLTWLPDLHQWMQNAANFVKPGGFLYLSDGHPFTWIFDDETPNMTLRYPYFQKGVTAWQEKGSYADRSADLQTTTCYQWQHTLGEIVTEVCRSGLRLEYLHEFGHGYFQAYPPMLEGEDGFWHHPEGDGILPMVFSLKAWKQN
jgi:2-polyprenyl-3-methyl-5-hydroxy-6-metoxy-1,4-benzoquinol methylase